MTQTTVQIYICIDEHGNYAAIGASRITDANKNVPLSIIEEEIKREGVATTTTSFKVNVQLPEGSGNEKEEVVETTAEEGIKNE